MDNYDKLITEYLGFIIGVINSWDLLLKISRESLQHNIILKQPKNL